MDYVRNLRTVEKVFKFSDGAGSQYKNKINFTNLAHHKEDVEVEWQFFTTSHEQGAVDGVGGTVKRCASHAIRRAVEECPMKTSFEMFEWAKNNINAVQFGYVDNTENEKHKQFLQERTNGVKKASGTQSHHVFTIRCRYELIRKVISRSSASKSHQLK
jgi:hypothetical protein